MIPKTIFSIWLGSELPPLVKMCVWSQKLVGYEHRLITLDNCFKDTKYIQECLNSPHPAQKWTKMSDYLRMYYLYNFGGIYLDADVQVMPGENFDAFLDNRMFAGRERNGWIGSSVIGSEKGHPFVKKWIEIVEEKFRGDDDKCFEASMELLTKGFHEWGWDTNGFKIYSDDYFFPYNHEDGTIHYTENTTTYHHFMKSWK